MVKQQGSIKTRSSLQLRRFKKLLAEVLISSQFYRRKLGKVGIRSARDIRSWSDFENIPLTTKTELIKDQSLNPPFGTNLTKAGHFYTTYTSGTSGKQLYIPYTPEDLERAIKIETLWLSLAGVTQKDRAYFILPYSLFPFVFEATRRLGASLVPNDARSYWEHLRAIRAFEVTLLETSPTEFFNLTETAREMRFNLKKLKIRKIVLTGEKAASMDSVRKMIKRRWGADCYDGIGSAELLVYTFDCKRGKTHLMQDDAIFEVADTKTGEASIQGELIATPLWRHHFPLIRYKTGDYIRLGTTSCRCGSNMVTLEGGILGRVDGAVRIRERSYFPSELEKVMNTLVGVNRYLIEIKKRNGVDEMDVFIELPLSFKPVRTELVQKGFIEYLGFAPRVFLLPPKFLPRYKWKGKRVVDLREGGKQLPILRIYRFTTILYKVANQLSLRLKIS